LSGTAAGTNALSVRKFNSPSTWTGSTSAPSSTSTTATGTGFTSFSDFAVGETQATKLAITQVNGGTSPTYGRGCTLAVQAQDSLGIAANVTSSTSISLSVKTGSGAISGAPMTNTTITAGSSSTTVGGVLYNRAESGIVLTASRTSGDALTAGDSAPFT